MKIHYADSYRTWCGKEIALYYEVETTHDTEKVTCKSCLKSMALRMKVLKPATPAATRPTTGRNQYPTGRVTK